MHNEIVVEINPYQTRVVLLEDGQPREIYIERRGSERLVGNIYNGKVQNVLPGMQAAFVDIGLERNAFLFAGDIVVDNSEFMFDGIEHGPATPTQSIQDIVKPGQEIMVQILKEPIGTKGARVTTHITLPGRTLVLMPTVNYIGVSRRIDNEEERARLRGLMEEIKPENMGVIVRTAAFDKNLEEISKDIDFLTRLWNKIEGKANFTSAPRLLHAEEALIFRTIRDLFTPDIEKLTINDSEFYERIQFVASIISPQLKDRVCLYQGEEELFDKYELDGKIEKALSHKVWLSNGGYIVIDQTEALTSIDVNTGRFVGNDNLQETIVMANCEAAKEIARQLRLRDISGIIIIDFIDMEDMGDKERVLEALRNETKKDRTKTNILGITQLGLVEMTRKKMRHNISTTLQMPCPYCKGDGKVLSKETIVLKIRKALLRCMKTQTTIDFLIEMHPDIADTIKEHSKDNAPILSVTPGKTVYISALLSLHINEFNIQPLTKKQDTISSLWKYEQS